MWSLAFTSTAILCHHSHTHTSKVILCDHLLTSKVILCDQLQSQAKKCWTTPRYNTMGKLQKRAMLMEGNVEPDMEGNNCCHWSKLSEMEWDGQEIMQQSSGLWCGTRDHLHAPVRILVSDSNKNLCFEVSTISPTISPTHKTNLCWFLVVCVKSESPTRLFWLPETGPWTSFYYALKLCEPWGQFLKQKHE